MYAGTVAERRAQLAHRPGHRRRARSRSPARRYRSIEKSMTGIVFVAERGRRTHEVAEIPAERAPHHGVEVQHRAHAVDAASNSRFVTLPSPWIMPRGPSDLRQRRTLGRAAPCAISLAAAARRSARASASTSSNRSNCHPSSWKCGIGTTCPARVIVRERQLKRPNATPAADGLRHRFESAETATRDEAEHPISAAVVADRRRAVARRQRTAAPGRRACANVAMTRAVFVGDAGRIGKHERVDPLQHVSRAAVRSMNHVSLMWPPV